MSRPALTRTQSSRRVRSWSVSFVSHRHMQNLHDTTAAAAVDKKILIGQFSLPDNPDTNPIDLLTETVRSIIALHQIFDINYQHVQNLTGTISHQENDRETFGKRFPGLIKISVSTCRSSCIDTYFCVQTKIFTCLRGVASFGNQ